MKVTKTMVAYAQKVLGKPLPIYKLVNEKTIKITENIQWNEFRRKLLARIKEDEELI